MIVQQEDALGMSNISFGSIGRFREVTIKLRKKREMKRKGGDGEKNHMWGTMDTR